MDADSDAHAKGDCGPAPGPALSARNLLHMLVIRWRLGQLGKKADSASLHGHHNANLLLTWNRSMSRLLGEAPPNPPLVKLRTPLSGPPVVMRTWADEARVLAAVRTSVPEVPRCLAVLGRMSLHTFAPGAPLSGVAGKGKPLGGATLRAIAEVLAGTATTLPDALPPLPAPWPEDKDTDGFLRHLAAFCEEQVYRPHRAEFGGLFDELGVPHDAMTRFLERSCRRPLTRRPFALLHTDIHRDNLVVRPDGRLFVLDWELATWGDPLHELATHLVRMGYTDSESVRMRELWAETLTRRGLSAMTDGLTADLPVYIAFEYAQSLYADVIRAAHALRCEPGEPSAPAVREAVRRVRGALDRAAGPIGLDRPGAFAREGAREGDRDDRGDRGDDHIEAALRDWLAERRGIRGRGTSRAWSGVRALPGAKWAMAVSGPPAPDWFGFARRTAEAGRTGRPHAAVPAVAHGAVPGVPRRHAAAGPADSAASLTSSATRG
jgi:aminoglycoside phosphotransferase (APT) family kinase protein